MSTDLRSGYYHLDIHQVFNRVGAFLVLPVEIDWLNMASRNQSIANWVTGSDEEY